jgi:hypothetical protein
VGEGAGVEPKLTCLQYIACFLTRTLNQEEHCGAEEIRDIIQKYKNAEQGIRILGNMQNMYVAGKNPVQPVQMAASEFCVYLFSDRRKKQLRF